MEFHTHIHLNYTKIEFYFVLKKKDTVYSNLPKTFIARTLHEYLSAYSFSLTKTI